jgi:HSP20 family protein
MVPSSLRNSSLTSLLDDFFDNSLETAEARPKVMPVDIEEHNGVFHIVAEVPGVKKEDINISVENNVLKISAQSDSEKKKDSKGYKYYERRSGKYERSFKLEDDLDSSKINATYENGLLKLEIPIKEKAKARQIPIK